MNPQKHPRQIDAQDLDPCIQALGVELLRGLDQGLSRSAAVVEPGHTPLITCNLLEDNQRVESEFLVVTVGPDVVPLSVHPAVGYDPGSLQCIVAQEPHGRPSPRISARMASSDW